MKNNLPLSSSFESNQKEIERSNKVFKWKCLISKGDVGAAAVIKKELEKDKPVSIVNQSIINDDVKEENVKVVEKEVKPKGKRGRPKKK